MAPHSSTLAWKIPWTEEPGGLQSMGLPRVGHDWATSLSLFTFMHWRRKWQPTPVFLPGESQGWGSLVGGCLWGHTESDTTEATQQQQQRGQINQIILKPTLTCIGITWGSGSNSDSHLVGLVWTWDSEGLFPGWCPRLPGHLTCQAALNVRVGKGIKSRLFNLLIWQVRRHESKGRRQAPPQI